MQDSKNRIQKNSTKEIRFAVLFGTKQDVFIIEHDQNQNQNPDVQEKFL